MPPTSPPISSHQNKYALQGLQGGYLSVTAKSRCSSVCVKAHKSLTQNYRCHLCNISLCLVSLFWAQLFCLHLSPIHLHCFLLLPHLPTFLFPLSRFIFFPPPDMLPGCVAETSNLSRGICGQHPCLLFSLFPLSFLPQFIHPSLSLLLCDSLMNTSSRCQPVPFTHLFPLNLLFLPLPLNSLPCSSQLILSISLMLDSQTFPTLFLIQIFSFLFQIISGIKLFFFA